MIDVYEITFKDDHFCKIKICQEDSQGQEIQESAVCFQYKELWDSAVNQHVTNFLRKHPNITKFEEYRDQERFITVYNFVSDDGSKLKIDATNSIQNMDIIKKLKKI